MLPLISGEFRAVADAELRFSSSGMAIGSVRGVANSRKKQDDGTWKDDKVCWVRVTAFKGLGEHMAESLTKGTLFTVTGRMETSEWETKEGEKRMSVEIIADTIGVSMAFAPAKQVSSEGGGQVQRSSGQAQSDPWAGAPPQSDEPPF